MRLRTDLDGIPAYRQGRSAPSGAGDVLKVSSNESPYPPLPSALDAVAEQARQANRYPDSSVSALSSALAERLSVPDDRLVFGAGSTESISQLIRALAGPGDEVVYPWRSFEAYPMLIAAAGATPVGVPLTPDHRHDLAAMTAAVTPATRLLVVCTPNNPTGTTVSRDEFRDLMAAVPDDVVVLLDEAYRHFDIEDDRLDGAEEFHRYPNLVIARTFSKAYGLAGLRVGFAIAPTTVANAMRKMAVPFGVTNLAQAAALAALNARRELEERVGALVAERRRVEEALHRQGWRLPASQANFLWFALGEATESAAAVFERHGLIVRSYPGEGLRITIAEPRACDRLIETAQALADAGLDNALRSGAVVAPD